MHSAYIDCVYETTHQGGHFDIFLSHSESRLHRVYALFMIREPVQISTSQKKKRFRFFTAES